MLTWEGKI